MDDQFQKDLKNDIDEAEQNDRLKNEGYDPLTGLPSMNMFFELAYQRRDRLIKEGKEPALVFFDCNGMKDFNMKYGFAEGDKLIIEMSKIIIAHFGKMSSSRFGGDRFAVVTNEGGLEEELKAIFEECRHMNGGRTLPVRVGIYPHRIEDVSSGVACDRAKIACDINRDSAVSCYEYFSEDLLKESEKRRYIIDNFEKAMEEGWIQAYFQPIVRSTNGRVSDEEALARWIDPVRGFMSPADFIPVLEETRLIYKLDLYIAKKIIEKKKIQEKAGIYVVPCSVNISRSDFEACDIVEEIRKLCDDTKMDPAILTIEITESVLTSDFDYMKKQVERFQALGFKVWMDDYGSGYSSPITLQKIRFDTIKLDMGFLEHFNEGDDSKIILSSLLKMAAGLGVDTVVEGVETEAEAEFLKEVGCTKLQGYHYCKPIPLNEVLGRYESGTQIGFENPDETEYYSAIGKVNLYELTLSADGTGLKDYFDTMPMAIVELGKNMVSIVRCNRSFDRFFEENISAQTKTRMAGNGGIDDAFFDEMRQCAETGKQRILDMHLKKGRKVNLLIRRIAVNPVSGAGSVVVVILGISEDVLAEEMERLNAERTIYSRLAALSGNYLVFYTVDPDTGSYMIYNITNEFAKLGSANIGKDIFKDAIKEAKRVIYKEDLDMFTRSFTKAKVMKQIEKNGLYSLTYRLNINDEIKYVCLRAAIVHENGRPLLIVGINDIDERIKHDQEQALRLSAARSKVHLDELTGVKNKHAYIDVENEINKLIEEGNVTPFALVMLDLIGLRTVNDAMGHRAGDDYLKQGCKIICDIFKHSPVYRVGGDEFVVIATGRDYDQIEVLMDSLMKRNRANKAKGGVVVAGGMARYSEDVSVEALFKRADRAMYENKDELSQLD